MRYLLTFCLLVMFSAKGICATVPDGISKTVVFIYRSQNGLLGQPDGTGFLVGIPNPAQQNTTFLYLVTAKHVLHTDPNNPDSPLYPEIFVRVNKKSEGSQIVRVPIIVSGLSQNVFFHSDPTVDIAVLPIHIDGVDQFDIAVLGEDLLTVHADLKKYHIGVGTDMFFTGMFPPFLGQNRNYPIVRFGKLAMIPEEKVPFGNENIDAYLVETFSFGGNSGSPVFFYPSSDNTPGSLMAGSPLLRIAGVMKGFYGDIEPILLAKTTSSNPQSIPVSKENSGIAIVVPSDYIREILDSPALENQRHPK